ncbi:hypothetical protein [Pseudoalteromonas luteoviolacea]|uniref:hypothetical protein n=1 Tax=Pseudoalteromonas luteoviolacea TaxID=43657 RepID=UPI001B37CEBF|nr:hypothetical protein [Pseudoalteromonas luteoviolacea]MBQ4837146.1 hypothetical protein [Pseudoalteromonas luteoviolacea]
MSLTLTATSEFEGAAYFRLDNCAFFLQDFYEPSHCQNAMLHLLVEDSTGWHEHILNVKVSEEFNVQLTETVEQAWGILEFCLTDFSEG